MDSQEELAERIHHLIHQYPTYGSRRIWALLRFRLGLRVNVKKVYRIMRFKGWMMHQRRVTPRARVRGKRSVATRSNERGAIE